MAYQPHYLASFGGKLSADGVASHTDIWNCNIRLVGLLYNDAVYTGGGNWAQPTTVLGEEAILAYCYPLLNTWFHSTVGAGASLVALMNAATLDYLKINKIAPTGKYADPHTTHQHIYPAANAGAAGGVSPWTLTLAMSWTTDIARGPGAHGRVYPPVALPGGMAPVVTSAFAASTATLAKNLVACFNNTDPGLPLTAVVASKINGGLHPILGAKVGTTIDSQRRRRSAVVEAYSPVVAVH